MHDEASPLLAQVALSVSPYITLPKAPTLPHTYTSLPSTLPPSILSSPGIGTNDANTPDQPPAYVTSAFNGNVGPRFAAHPSSILAQNRTLLASLAESATQGRQKVETWEQEIAKRDLAEKRRVAPGWLDSEAKILSPEHRKMGEATAAGGPAAAAGAGKEAPVNLMDEQDAATKQRDAEEEGLGRMMDKAFGGLG